MGADTSGSDRLDRRVGGIWLAYVLVVGCALVCGCKRPPLQEEHAVPLDGPDGQPLPEGTVHPVEEECVPMPSPAARPEWARRLAARTIVPQDFDLDASEWPSSERSTLAEGILWCAAAVPEEQWPTDIPDLVFDISVGGHCPARVLASSNQYSVEFLLQDVTLREGDEVRFEVSDEDGILGWDRVGELTLVHQGTFPVAGANDVIAIRCRPVPDQVVSQRSAAAEREADAALDRALQTAAPSPLTIDTQRSLWRVPQTLLSTVAWSGWRHPRVHRLAARYQAIRAGYDVGARAALETVWAATPDPGPPVSMGDGVFSVQARLVPRAEAIRDVQGTRLVRSGEEIPWAVEVSLTVNEGHGPVVGTRDVGPLDELRFVVANGSRVDAIHTDTLRLMVDDSLIEDVGIGPWFELEAQPGQTIRWLAAPRQALELGPGGVHERTAVRFRNGTRTEFLRLK